ncbi:S41 family peptidase [Gemmatimonas groenlandica]|uniref:Tricorn protease homolog n=1 Tax=Gemmatimonas groenlandica TaxID=2732249 RepID=A0A6M4IWD0_9BACT|nr:DPP IV N-terminal domain-containing protein [Gemmatimonas groenlandica]QJR37917.1 peptidase S41 [Gemmatimonas groenlandica]
MSRIAVTTVALAALAAGRSASAQAPSTPLRPVAEARASFAEPGISPDAREIAFVSAGDIWTVPTAGGEARLLVAHAANESHPLYSPDGARLAFVSNRAGGNDIWILTLSTGAVRRLTFDDGNESLDGWSRDGRWIYFSSTAHDISSMNDVYRVRAEGGTPMPVAADRFASEFMSAPNADGSITAIVARGFGLSQWWRKGRSHLDESELWLVRGDGSKPPAYEQVMPRGARQLWPMWSADGTSLYFVSDRNGSQNLWQKPLAGDARALTRFTTGRVLWPSMSGDGNTIAFERDFAIWTFDVRSGAARPVPIARRGAVSGDAVQHLNLQTGFSELTVSPDGRKVAFLAHGDVFVAGSSDGGDALRVTASTAAETHLDWAPDSRRLVYAANRGGRWRLYTYDLTLSREAALTDGGESDLAPRFSPDGKQVAYIHGNELRVVSVESKTTRTMAKGIFGRAPMVSNGAIAWSPDGRWIAFLTAGTKMFVNAWVVSSSGGEAKQVSWLSNTRANSISWSADGGYLLLDTGMRVEAGQVARVDLLPYTPRFREEQLEALFRDETPGRIATPVAPAPVAVRADSAMRGDSVSYRPDPRNVRIVFEGIRGRLSFLPLGVDVGVQTMSRDGKQLAVTAVVANQPTIYTYSLDDLSSEPAVARPLVSSGSAKGSVQFSPDGKSLWYLDGGRVTSVALDTRASKPLTVRAELDVDFHREKWDVFHQAWEFLADNFYDPNFHGFDWNGVQTSYAPLIAGAGTADELRRLLSLMVGELDASHMGISAPPTAQSTPTGRIGLEFDRYAYEQRGEFRISAVIPGAAADLAGNVRVGDRLVELDAAPLGAGVNLDSLLAFKVGRRVTLTLASGESAASRRRTVAVSARNGALEKVALYRSWIEERRAIVAKASNGTLGYAHIFDMGANALANLNTDLDDDNQLRGGLVVDVRNNNGGFMNGHVLDVLQRTSYVTMQRRDAPPVPGRPVLGQRSLDMPTIALTSQQTLSDGENFTEGYRTLGLGKVVGEPTAGWDVYTSAGTMVDGTTVRLPFMTNAQRDLVPLERHSRPVDIAVDRPMGESYTGRDTQLERAVAELLKTLANSRR